MYMCLSCVFRVYVYAVLGKLNLFFRFLLGGAASKCVMCMCLG